MPSKIEWCDETINPLGWGCWGPGGTPEAPKPCSYCYARRMASRGMRPCELCRQFIPHWHPEQLDKPHIWTRPRRIFVQSMGDLFHPCTPAFQIELVLAQARSCPRHTFIFLTKNPARYKEFNETLFGEPWGWPRNCWLGTTVACQEDADERLPELFQAQAPVRFVSHEPLLENVNVRFHLAKPTGKFRAFHGKRQMEMKLHGLLSWAIIGAQTGPGAVKPRSEWIQSLIYQYRAAGVPVFLKDNLNWPEKIQEWPG